MNDRPQSAVGAGERSYLGTGSRITGELQFPGTVELPGYVKGRVEAASIVIEDSGEVEGEIRAASVTIRGQFNGKLFGGTVTLQSSARVTGDITYDTLTIDSGAQVEGNCRLNQSGGAKGPADPTNGSAVE